MRRALVLVLLWLAALPGAPAHADAGPWGWPLDGPHEVSRPFAPPASAYGPGHRGADLPSTAGAPVHASAAGRVAYAGLLAGRGVVVVTHGALRTTYEPVSASVAVGAAVQLGEVVGRLDAGHLGCPVAACLHWGLRRGEHYLDPVRLVERGPVRLLPMDGGGAHGRLAAGVQAVRGRALATGDAPSLPPAAPAADRSTPAPSEEPAWSLRADEAPLGAAAVAALVVGIGLLARPRPQAPRPGPPAVPLAAGVPLPVEGAPVAVPGRAVAGGPRDVDTPSSPVASSPAASPAAGDGARVLDLSAERQRRRPA